MIELFLLFFVFLIVIWAIAVEIRLFAAGQLFEIIREKLGIKIEVEDDNEKLR